MLIYRIENRDKRGPIHGYKVTGVETYEFQGDVWQEEVTEPLFPRDGTFRQHRRLPEGIPFFDNIYHRISDTLRFGWRSLELCMGFMRPGTARRLTSAGFHISVYDISPRNLILMPDGQVVWKNRRYRPVCRLPIRGRPLYYPFSPRR